MAMDRVLYVCHNHPAQRPGGAEIYAMELYESVRQAGEFEPIMVAKTGPPVATGNPRRQGTRFALAGEDPNVYLMYTQRDEIDMIFGTAIDKRLYTKDWRRFLEAIRPDLVHFQHTLFLGYDLVRETRNVLPTVPIFYTLHDFLPICHHSGQMVRTQDLALCNQASPRRCHDCFPNIAEDTFFLRERYIKSALAGVDVFIAPSEQLRQRYIAWGVPGEKLVLEEYGRLPIVVTPDPPDAGRRRRIGYFGQITRFKGVDILLEAMKILQQEGVDVELELYGANLAAQAPAMQERISALLEETADVVRFHGQYERDQVPTLMSDVDWIVVPSIWWENSPLVIQEAFICGRPVITSDVGGMAEKVRPELDGLHFSVGDPQSLSDAIRRAVSEPDLWDHSRGQLPEVHPMNAHMERVSDLYRQSLKRARFGPGSSSSNGHRSPERSLEYAR